MSRPVDAAEVTGTRETRRKMASRFGETEECARSTKGIIGMAWSLRVDHRCTTNQFGLEQQHDSSFWRLVVTQGLSSSELITFQSELLYWRFVGSKDVGCQLIQLNVRMLGHKRGAALICERKGHIFHRGRAIRAARSVRDGRLTRL